MPPSLVEILDIPDDPRVTRAQLHNLIDILVLSMLVIRHRPWHWVLCVPRGTRYILAWSCWWCLQWMVQRCHYYRQHLKLQQAPL